MRKNYSYIIICFIISFFSIGAGYGKENKINVIELYFDKSYFSSLQLIITCEGEDMQEKKLFISSNLSEENKCTFLYPDSIYDRICHMDIIIPTDNDSIRRNIQFLSINDNDTISAVSCNFQRYHSIVHCKYVKTDIYPNIFCRDYNTGQIVRKTSYSFGCVIETKDLELISSIKSMHSGYSLFERGNYAVNKDYVSEIQKYMDITELYPDSQSLISMLASNLTRYKSPYDIERIYALFSKEQQQSYFGKYIYKYISDKIFHDMNLQETGSYTERAIIVEPEKFNLIIFSASWCAPCHEQIPVLKEIYADLKNKLEMTYISIDEESTIVQWEELMKKEQIPWRSLLAAKKIGEVRKKYFVQTIPHSFLVHPGGYMEIIDIRTEANKEKLYKTVKSDL